MADPLLLLLCAGSRLGSPHVSCWISGDALIGGSGGTDSSLAAGPSPRIGGCAYESDLDLRLAVGEVGTGEKGSGTRVGVASPLLWAWAEEVLLSSSEELTGWLPARLLTRNGRGSGGGGGGGGGGGEHALDEEVVLAVAVVDLDR